MIEQVFAQDRWSENTEMIEYGKCLHWTDEVKVQRISRKCQHPIDGVKVQESSLVFTQDRWSEGTGNIAQVLAQDRQNKPVRMWILSKKHDGMIVH